MLNSYGKGNIKEFFQFKNCLFPPMHPRHTYIQTRKTLNMEIFLIKKLEFRPPLPSKLWSSPALKWMEIKGSSFLWIKFRDICGLLQLVSCLYLHWSSSYSILKKRFQKSPLQRWQNFYIFWKFGKTSSFWLVVAPKPRGQFWTTRHQ